MEASTTSSLLAIMVSPWYLQCVYMPVSELSLLLWKGQPFSSHPCFKSYDDWCNAQPLNDRRENAWTLKKPHWSTVHWGTECRTKTITCFNREENTAYMTGRALRKKVGYVMGQMFTTSMWILYLKTGVRSELSQQGFYCWTMLLKILGYPVSISLKG